MHRVFAARGTWIVMVALAVLAAAAAALAGPIIQFGDNGYLKLDFKGQVYIENTDYGAGLDLQSHRTDLHFQRFRLTATAMLDDVWGYKFQTCGHTGSTITPAGYLFGQQGFDENDRDVRIIDTYAIANFSDAFNLKVGLTKLPVSRANLDDCFAPLTLDRSNFVYNPYGVSAAKFSRDIGVLVHGNLADDHFKYFAGAFQGREGQSVVMNPMNAQPYRTTLEPASNLLYAARIHYSFLDPELGSGYVGTHFGEDRILTVGLGFAYEASAVFKNVAFDPATGTATVQNNETADMTEFAADLFFEYPTAAGTPTINGQYLKVDFDDAYKTNHNPADLMALVGGLNGQKEGGYGKLAWTLPGNIGEDGLLQPYVIYEHWEYALFAGVMDQTIDQFAFGVNYYIHQQNVRWTVEYQKTDFDKNTPLFVGPGNLLGNVSDITNVRTMLQVVF